MTTPENPARWAPDPFGRHQYRYWDGVRWTDHVSDDGLVGSDPATHPAPTPTPGTTPVASAPVPGTGATAWSTPVNRSHDPTAVLGRRYGAFAIDAVICLLAFAAFFFATADTHTRAEMLRDPECHLSRNDSSMVECDDRLVVTVDDTVYEGELGTFAGLSIVFTFLYFAVVEGAAGGSLGKQMTGLRVVTPEGARIGVGRSTLRWLVFAVDGPLSVYLCGIITSSVSTGHRRLGDMAAGSYVVGRADAGRMVAARPR